MMTFDLNRYWYRKNPFAQCLIPFSGLFQSLVEVRRFLFQHGFKKSTKLPVPVIIVGNITVGGNGKTPMVIWLVEFLRQQGYQPGIISRGYGGKNLRKPLRVTDASDVQQVGDEAILLQRKTQCPMVVGRDRVTAAKLLLEIAKCDVIISDDGLQHYALRRDIEIVMVDGMRRFGNGYCLPAGPLREPISRLREVDFVIVTQGQAHANEYNMQLHPGDLYALQDVRLTKPLQDLRGQKVHAIAGIGNPARFFRTLEQAGLIVVPHQFADHYSFQASDLAPFSDAPIVMTEKDAVKCKGFAKENCWVLPVKAEVDERFGKALMKLVSSKR